MKKKVLIFLLFVIFICVLNIRSVMAEVCSKEFRVGLDSITPTQRDYVECKYIFNDDRKGNYVKCAVYEDSKELNVMNIKIDYSYGAVTYEPFKSVLNYSFVVRVDNIQSCEDVNSKVRLCELDSGEITLSDETYCKANSKKHNNSIDYEHFCQNTSVKKVSKIIGIVLRLATYIGPLIMIILGIMDFVKVIPSSDEKALNKAINALVRRFLASVAIVLAPTILLGLISFLGFSDGIEDESNGSFGPCTVCILKPGECVINE